MARIEVIRGDITRLDVDAIVNAANPTLLGGGGVDGAIHAAAGRELLEACRALPEVRPGVRCPTGQARITPGFGLTARFVIHTVGPVFHDGKQGEGELLASCYRQSLALARENGLHSIAFPAIGTGVYGVPSYFGSAVATSTCAEFLWHDTTLERVLLVAFRELDEAYLREHIRRANLAPATRTDWKSLPLSEQRAPLTLERSYTPREFERLKRGEFPLEMEDKWFVFYEEPWLYLHRSWTGICIFQVRFEPAASSARIAEAWVTRDPEHYKSDDPARDADLLLAMLDGRAGRS
jgi:O-acetyl-ADP-ribose deacetylase (regulator of RNase III)